MLVMVLARATGRLLQRIYLNVFGYVVLNPAHIATCFLFPIAKRKTGVHELHFYDQEADYHPMHDPGT